MMEFKLSATSFLLGLCCAVLLGILVSARNPDSYSPVGRYQATSSENGFVILDTQSGEYILESNVGYIGNHRLIRGQFEQNFEAGRDIFSKK